MAHKTLIDGTSYNVVSGTSMVSGATYNISSGNTLVDGTRYNINFGPKKTAMLYSDGSFVFQDGDDIAAGKSLTASYTDFEDTYSPPWNGKQQYFTSVDFNTEISPSLMYYWFYNASNMVANISDFHNLNMSNVTSMRYTYEACSNLTGSPVCGDKVTNMCHTYFACYNLTGAPVCGSNVTDMASAYYSCSNLTGSPVCGDRVTSMYYTYGFCSNLTGSPVCGSNVIDMAYAYYYCCNLRSNAYFYSPKVSYIQSCFGGRNTSERLNIYVVANSTTNTTIHYNNTSSLVGANIIWTNAGTYQYNASYNIYIYPVENVAAARAANGD